jgi:hypothetical protein
VGEGLALVYGSGMGLEQVFVYFWHFGVGVCMIPHWDAGDTCCGWVCVAAGGMLRKGAQLWLSEAFCLV